MIIEDAQRILSNVLLRAARDPRGVDSALFNMNAALLSAVGVQNELPIVGVATTRHELTMPTGSELDADTIVIMLRSELPKLISALREQSWIPQEFPIETLVTGPIGPTARPATGGMSVGEGKLGGESGTFGCVVTDAYDSYILSCNHVVAGTNAGHVGISEVWQPSIKDRGTSQDKIGRLAAFKSIDFIVKNAVPQPNEFDAALAKADQVGAVTAGANGVAINGSRTNIPLREKVQKYGWKTGHTAGHFIYRTDYIAHYPRFGDALFERQLGIVAASGLFSDEGDSGAVLLDMNNAAVGLIANSSSVTKVSFANPIEPILRHFGVAPV